MKAVVFRADSTSRWRPSRILYRAAVGRGDQNYDGQHCGSDLHPYEGRAPWTRAWCSVTRTWAWSRRRSGVDRIGRGPGIGVVHVACGTCRTASPAGRVRACERTDRPADGRLWVPHDGSYWGGQAEYLRVPWADSTCSSCRGTEHENDFTMLSDISRSATMDRASRVRPGDTVVIFGAGPVGPMAAHSAAPRGAAQVSSSTGGRTARAGRALRRECGQLRGCHGGGDDRRHRRRRWTAESKRSATRLMTPLATSIRKWRWTSSLRSSAPSAGSEWAGSTTRKTRERLPRTPSRPVRLQRRALFDKAITMGRGQCLVKGYTTSCGT